MKVIMAFLVVILFSIPVLADDSIDTLTVKRDLAQERVLRIQAELEIMRIKFQQGQMILKQAQADLSIAEGNLKAVQPKEIKPDASK